MKTTAIILLFFLVSLSSIAKENFQENPSAPVEEADENAKSLNQQFINLKDRSNSYQEYKVVKVTWLNEFWKNVKDTIDAAKTDFSAAQTEINKQNSELESIKKTLALKEAEVNSSEYDKAHITVMGMDFQKGSYIMFNWIVIFILLALVGVTFFSHKNSQRLASIKKTEYDNIDRELVDFKVKARERELKIKRELQTELNRVEELSQEIALLRKSSSSRL